MFFSNSLINYLGIFKEYFKKFNQLFLEENLPELLEDQKFAQPDVIKVILYRRLFLTFYRNITAYVIM